MSRDQQVHALVESIDRHIAELEQALGGAYEANAAASQAEHELRLAEANHILSEAGFPPAKQRDARLTLATEVLHLKADMARAQARATAIEIDCRQALLSAMQTKARLLAGEMRLAR